MDEAGIDLQVISHGPTGTQRIDADTAVKLATGANEHLQMIIDSLPEAGVISLRSTGLGRDR